MLSWPCMNFVANRLGKKKAAKCEPISTQPRVEPRHYANRSIPVASLKRTEDTKISFALQYHCTRYIYRDRNTPQ